MADVERDERTEEPSQRRLQEARDRGQVPRSRELTNFASLIGGSAVLLALGPSLAADFARQMRQSLGFDPAILADSWSMVTALGVTAGAAVQILLPLLAALVVLVVLASIALGGWNVSISALKPDFSRLSLGAGLARILSAQGAGELGKAVLKLLVVGAIAFGVVKMTMGEVLNLGALPTGAAIGRSAHLLAWTLVALSAGLAVIALVDVPMQLMRWKSSLRMSRHELREEAKESDGRPEVKGRIRQLQQQAARRRMMQDVPKADVVIVNPTHFAVALKYDAKKMRAPRVVAKGADLIAQNIRRIATENRVAIFESPKLARALFRSTDINSEIPADLYVAVAQVLSYIFQVRVLDSTTAARLTRPEPEIGAEYSDV
jgi:flagellar biosynthesis protein FlhB